MAARDISFVQQTEVSSCLLLTVYQCRGVPLSIVSDSRSPISSLANYSTV